MNKKIYYKHYLYYLPLEKNVSSMSPKVQTRFPCYNHSQSLHSQPITTTKNKIYQGIFKQYIEAFSRKRTLYPVIKSPSCFSIFLLSLRIVIALFLIIHTVTLWFFNFSRFPIFHHREITIFRCFPL